MDRLNKKCFIASAGVHLLVGLVAFVGPAFSSSTVKEVPDFQIINFEPDILVDSPVSGGGTPNAARSVQPQPPVPQPEPPKPQPRSEPKVQQPAPRDPEPVEPKPRIDPESFDVKESPKPKRPQVSTIIETRRPPRKNPSPDIRAEQRRLEEERQQLAAAVRATANGIRQEASPATVVQEGSPGPGGGGRSYADYISYVQKMFDQAWIAPSETVSDSSEAIARVVIARDGTILKSEFVNRSGDAAMDASVQRALDRVTKIRPFPEGSTDKERRYLIRFNLKVKRGLA